MKHAYNLAALLCALLVSGNALTSDDHWEAHRLRQSGAILPLEQILESVHQTHPGRILEVKLDEEHGSYVYEIELLDDYGRVWELEIDATSGRLLESEQEE